MMREELYVAVALGNVAIWLLLGRLADPIDEEERE